MSFNLKSITREKIIKPPRMIVLGTEKVGKTSFVSGADNVVMIPIGLEKGIDAIEVAKFPTVERYEDLEEALKTLAEEEHDFEHVGLDSASALEPIIWEKVCREAGVKSIEQVGGGYGKGYLEALYYWQQVMDMLDYLRDERNMGSCIIGHVKVKRFDDPERQSYDTYAFDINEKISAALYRWSDCIGFANIGVDIAEEVQGFNKKKTKAIHVDSGNRFLYTQKTPAHPGGGRGVFGRLPEAIDLSWQAFKDAVREVIAEESKASKPKTKK